MLKHRHSRGRDHATKILNVKYQIFKDFISSCARTTNCQRYYVGDTSQCGLHNVVIDDRLSKDGGRPS